MASELSVINLPYPACGNTDLVANAGVRCNQLSKISWGLCDGLALFLASSQGLQMATFPKGTAAVIFVAQRTVQDEEGYHSAAHAMDALAAEQPGYLAMESVRGTDGLGITVSYWQSDSAAKAWRDHPEHQAIRDAGRDRWYAHYSLQVAEVTRSYDWVKVA
jgi:heme-degrading monooxygenase HmoA